MSKVNDIVAQLQPVFQQLNPEDLAAKLALIFYSVFRRDQEWASKLVPDFCDSKAWIKPIRDFKELVPCIEECTKSGNWAPLFDLKFLRTDESDQRSKGVGTSSSLKLDCFKTAFETKYQAPYPEILLSVMDAYYPGGTDETKYYNRSSSVVQSSGMGKSRMMDHCATLRFTIPFNIHEEMEPRSGTYPPFDHRVRDFITQKFGTERDGITRPLVFLQALFTETIAQLQSYTAGTPQEIACQWYDWMNEGLAVDSVSENRRVFYQRVLDKAHKLEGQVYQGTSAEVLKSRKQELQLAAESFVNRLWELGTPKERRQEFSAIVYFDEAHTLFSSAKDQPLDGLAPYFTLMHVLSVITDIPIFFVFLSTNSNINAFALTDKSYSSLRVQHSSKLIPPFFELPFDAFSRNFELETRAIKKWTLSGVCELEQMSKFGRPMWYSLYQSLSKKHIIKLAITKLETGDHPQLAALDSRVLIEYDSRPLLSLQVQAELVKSHMRCVFNIPKGREYLYSGYPSEPMLSEAAGHILKKEGKPIIDTAPEILSDALKTGLLAKGERGELVARTLLTVAHDLAALEKFIDTLAGPQYHRPIKLISLLEKFLAPVIWEKVRHATPEEAYDGDPELEEAFKNTWVNFSHFVCLGDFRSYNRLGAFALLLRGAAIQMHDNQENLDIAIPLYTGDLISEMSSDQTSIAQFQVKNTLYPPITKPDPSLIGDDVNLPILSIVMQLGKEQQADQRVRIKTTLKSSSPVGHTRSAKSQPTDVTCRHYSIELFGCTNDTYACVGENGQKYRNLLRTETKPFHDYPRENSKECLEAVYTLKPVLYTDNPASLNWFNEST